jgi:HK97 family phage prohead protease
MEFILADGKSPNTKGYRVEIPGIRTERFKNNPVMLYEHDPEKVIGRWENIRIEKNRLVATPVFDTDDPLGKETARKVENNFLRAASVGIIPLNMEYVNDEYVMTECEQVEASIVSIPSDAGAVRLYNEKLEELSFDRVKRNFNLNNNNQKTNQMDAVFKLSYKTVESLKLPGDYTSKDVELAVAEKDKEIETLNAKLKTVETRAQADYLTGAVKAGRISETERRAFEKLAEKGCFDDIKTMIDAKPESATATLAAMVQKSNPAAGRETWDYLTWMKKDPKGLARIKAENPTEFGRLQADFKVQNS